jgi:hypothetical protein
MSLISKSDIHSLIVKNNVSIDDYILLADDYYDSLLSDFDIDGDYLPETISSKIKRVLVLYVQLQVAIDNIGLNSVQQANGYSLDAWDERRKAWSAELDKAKNMLLPDDFYSSDNKPPYVGNGGQVGTWVRS